jgi:hypothetical protein
MTFKDLAIGDIFEYRDHAHEMKVGVKMSEREAWLLQERKPQVLAHNRKAWKPACESGRLALDGERRLCVVHSMSHDRMVGYAVVPVAYVTGRRGEFTLIKVEPGEIKDEVDIILRRISQSTESLETWTTALKSMLEEL